MANEQITRKQNDTGPPISDTLKTDGSADDLSGATVKFTLWKSDGTGIVDKNTANTSVEDAANGKVKYTLQSSDLESSGLYYYEWEVEYSNGEIRTYPNTEEGVRLVVVPEGG